MDHSYGCSFSIVTIWVCLSGELKKTWHSGQVFQYLLGGVIFFKMNILQNLQNVFQMVRILLTRKSLSILNGSLSSFNGKQSESTKNDGGADTLQIHKRVCDCPDLAPPFRSPPKKQASLVLLDHGHEGNLAQGKACKAGSWVQRAEESRTFKI